MKHFNKLLYVAVKELLTQRMLLGFLVVFGVLLQAELLTRIMLPFLMDREADFDLRKFSSGAQNYVPLLLPIWVVGMFKNSVFRRQLMDGLNRYDLYVKLWMQGILLWVVFVVCSYAEASVALLFFKHDFSGFGEAVVTELQYKLPAFGFKFMLMLSILLLMRSFISILVYIFYPILELLLDFGCEKLLKTEVIGNHLPGEIISKYSKFELTLGYDQLAIYTFTCALLMALSMYAFFKKEL